MRNIYKYLLMLSGLTALTGCKKYLDTLPDNRTVISSPEQVSKLLVNAYPRKSYVPFTETMSDNAEDKNNTGLDADPITFKINTQAYRYLDVEGSDNDSPVAYFYACYKAIAAANQALVYCNKGDEYKAQKGEALVARAYAHFMLVTLFAKAYDPLTAANDPGIPYVTTVETDVFAKYDRKNVQYVYDMIDKDLQEGLPLIDERIYGDAPKYHFNLKAANAFASRFYLFKREYSKVMIYSNAVLGANAASLIRNQTRYSKMQYESQLVYYTSTAENANLLLQDCNSRWYNYSFTSYRFGFGLNLYNKYYKNAFATGGSFNSNIYGSDPKVYNLPKFRSYKVGKDANNVNVVMPLFTTDEVLFNRIEAQLMLNQSAAAIADLETWINVNMSNAYLDLSSVVSFYRESSTDEGKKNALLKLNLDLKQQAYNQEGLRWFDILRLKMPVTHKVLGETDIVLTADDNRKMLQFPQEAVAAGIPLNPR